jgi:hypothetical protein
MLARRHICQQHTTCHASRRVLRARAQHKIVVERHCNGPRFQTLLGAAGGTLLSLLLVSSPVAAAQEVFEGPARIVDGDTLYIGKDKVRLYGVDAPEKAQVCRDSKGQPYEW